MALIRYTSNLHQALRHVAELEVGQTQGHDGHWVWMVGGEITPPESDALVQLFHARLVTVESSRRLTWNQPARVLLTFDGSDRLADWDREHRAGAA
ncbi:hypothetical protein N8J89_07770 [Crossiella sp. CA-258035]|uniref:hypothetical protein n=1 Tax=Crossiella sp. CA-258035 TaxID=2981138 RepID=UPI0024BC5FDD|nr:hypothetical protein [Crossiella sp. CA-258035]WHT20951.1 hypothetical protein N8J89_07770 [Crossiella sp. CA-258035]